MGKWESTAASSVMMTPRRALVSRTNSTREGMSDAWNSEMSLDRLLTSPACFSASSFANCKNNGRIGHLLTCLTSTLPAHASKVLHKHEHCRKGSNCVDVAAQTITHSGRQQLHSPPAGLVSNWSLLALLKLCQHWHPRRSGT